jgi:hypothetical protein
MRAFFRAILATEPDVDAALADRLAGRCVKAVARMMVWDAGPADATPAGAAAESSATASAPASDATTTDDPKVVGQDTGEAFDPFAFSIIVVLKRQGRAALLKRLDAIVTPEHLHKMAAAQHIGVDKSITSAKALREAIADGAEQRLADRRAAAS